MFKKNKTEEKNVLKIGKQVNNKEYYNIPIGKLNNRLMIIDENQNIILNYINQIVQQEKNVFIVVENDELKNEVMTIMKNNSKNIKLYQSTVCFKTKSSISLLTKLLMLFIEEKNMKNVENFIENHIETFKIDENVTFTQKSINEFINNIFKLKFNNEEEIRIAESIIEGFKSLKNKLAEDYKEELDIFEDVKNRKNIICSSESNEDSLFYYVLNGLMSSKEVEVVNENVNNKDYFIFLPLYCSEKNEYIDLAMSVYLAQSRSLGKSMIVYTNKYDRKRTFLNSNFKFVLLRISENNYLFIDDGIPNHLEIEI